MQALFILSHLGSVWYTTRYDIRSINYGKEKKKEKHK